MTRPDTPGARTHWPGVRTHSPVAPTRSLGAGAHSLGAGTHSPGARPSSPWTNAEPLRRPSGRVLRPSLLILGWAGILGAQLLAADRSLAVEPRQLWKAAGIENVVCITTTPDLDGDGRTDVVFETYDAGAPQQDHVIAIRGASDGVGEVLWSARPLGGPSNSGGYGDACLRTGEDLNGDGYPEILYGAAWGNRSAFALDGRTGMTEWSFDSYSDSPPAPPVSGWVYAVDSLGEDLDDDGVPEVLFSLGSDNDGLYCASGANGSVLWRYQAADAIFDVHSVADLDGDGIRDVAIGVGDSGGSVVTLSGDGGPFGTGFVLWLRETGSVLSLVEVPDLNGDGLNEVIAGDWNSRLLCFSGINGATLWDVGSGPDVMRVVLGDDVDGDGYPDLAVGTMGPAARVFSGRTGALVWIRTVNSFQGGDVWAIDWMGDVTGDGIADVCAGSFNENVYAMDGVDGTILWEANVNDRILTVRGAPDLDGNGWPDVVAGTQKLSTGGDCYAFDGRGALDPAGLPGDADGGGDSPGDPNGSAPGGGAEDPNGPFGPGGLAALTEPGLFPSGPNPFRDRSSWVLALPTAARVDAAFVDAAGRSVLTRSGLEYTAGVHALVWDGRDDEGAEVPAGVYQLRLDISGVTRLQAKVVRLR